MQFKLVKRPPLTLWKRALLPVWAILLAFLISGIFIAVTGTNVPQAFWLIFKGSLGSRFAFLETLIKMTPMCLTGLAVTIAFRAKFWNIGAEGQLYMGAMAAAWIGILPLSSSPFIQIPVIIMAGFVAGGLLALFPAWLKVKFKADDVVTTLMLNYVVIFLMRALLDGVWRDPISGWPHSPSIIPSAIFPRLLPPGRFHIGFLIAIAAAVLCFILLKYTKLGYRLRAVGFNPQASRYGGINVKRTLLATAFISGGLAGLAGVGEVCGMQFYLIDGISSDYGYYGVAIAMLANLQPLGVILASFFFAVIFTGSQTMSRYTGVPVYISDIMQGLTLITMLMVLLLNRYKIKISRK